MFSFKARILKLIYFAFLSLLCFSAIFQLSNQRGHPIQSTEHINFAPHAADWFAENINTLIMDKFGKPKRILYAEEVRHYDEIQTSDLKKPRLRSEKPEYNWVLTSDTGRIYHNKNLDDIEKIDFWQSVHMTRSPRDNKQKLNIVTDHISFYPKTNEAKTEQPITFSQAGNVIKGKGMNAEMDQETIHLLSKVRGKHVS